MLSNKLAIGQQMLTASSTFMVYKFRMQHEVKLAKLLLSEVSPGAAPLGSSVCAG